MICKISFSKSPYRVKGKAVKLFFDNNRSIMLKLLLFSLMSIFMTVGAFFVIVKYFPAFSLYVSGKVDWGVFDGFVGVLSFSLLVGGLTFALAEYIDTERAKHVTKLAEERDKAKYSLEIYQEIFEKLSTPEQEAARRWIFQNIPIKEPDEEIAVWFEHTHAKIMRVPRGNGDELPEGQKALLQTLNCFDYIGYIYMNYWNIREDSNSNLDWISPSVAKVWTRIGPYVLHLRSLRNSPDWHLAAEYLGTLCIDWRAKKGSSDEFLIRNSI